MGINRLLLTLVFSGLSFVAVARPISYPGGIMVMTMNDASEYSQMLSYSPSAKDAFGLRTDYQRGNQAWLHSLTYNHLAWRKNGQDSQANLFLMSGLGAAAKQGEFGPAGWVGLETDWEDRRFLVSYENRQLISSVTQSMFNQKARIGIAPYIAGYDGVHTWLMLQVDHQPRSNDPLTVTPLVRLFNTAALGEVGISNRGRLLFNFTYQY